MNRPNAASGIPYVPPFGWDALLGAVAMQRRRQAQLLIERPPVRDSLEVDEVRVERATPVKMRRVNARRKGH